MTGVSGAGGWPGDDPLAAQQVVLGELAETPEGVQGLPYEVRPPGRGAYGTALARAVSMLVDLPAQLGPHGWALADRPGQDLARARAQVREGLDALAVAGDGYAGVFVVPVLGPVSLAAQVWLARGDRGVSDPGALHELAQSAAEGTGEHLAAVRRALPGAQLRVLLLEPRLADVVGGRVPTFSGRDLLRAVPGPVAGERLAAVVAAARSAGAEQAVLHVGAQAEVAELAVAAGADGVGLVPAGAAGWEQAAGLAERGLRLWLGSTGAAAEAPAVAVPWGRVGLPAAGLADVVLLVPDTEAGPDAARGALRGAVAAARVLAERAAG